MQQSNPLADGHGIFPGPTHVSMHGLSGVGPQTRYLRRGHVQTRPRTSWQGTVAAAAAEARDGRIPGTTAAASVPPISRNARRRGTGTASERARSSRNVLLIFDAHAARAPEPAATGKPPLFAPYSEGISGVGAWTASS